MSRRRPITMTSRLAKKSPAHARKARILLKLTQHFNCIHFAGGYPVEAVDIHASIRHLDVLFDKLTITDKVMHAYSLGKERIEDVMEMVRIACEVSEEEFTKQPYLYTNIKLDIAAQTRPTDDRRLPAVYPTRSGRCGDTLHTGRRHGSGDNGRGCDALDCRSAVGHRLVPICHTGHALRHRHLHLERRYEIRRPRPLALRNTCGPPRSQGRWRGSTTCQCVPAAVAPPMCRTGKPCGKPRTRSGQPCNPARIWSTTPPDGWRAG